MPLNDEVLAVVSQRARSGFENRESVYLGVIENEGEALGLPPDAAQVPAAVEQELRGAIEAAFETYEAEARSYPAVTDNDRLTSAFEALTKRNILAIENCGHSLPHGYECALERAVAYDAVAPGLIEGHCFYHSQDVDDAVAEGGLCLAYATYREDVAPASPGAAKVCPTCNGRGFIQPDPNKFPQRCPQHIETVAAPAAATPAEQLGRSIVEVLTEAGLQPHWSGSTGERILLPRFRWQRRPRLADKADVETFWQGWELELRAGYSLPLRPITEMLAERALDAFEGFSNYGPAIFNTLKHRTENFLAEEQKREAAWAHATDNDRLSAALADLASRDVLTDEMLGITIQDGWAAAGTVIEKTQRGVVFFHAEDVLDAMKLGELWLAFGALGERAEETLALGDEVVSTLKHHGLVAEWNRSARQRIRIAPFEWKRRRWTPAPAIEPARLKKPSVWSRMFGGGVKAAALASNRAFLADPSRSKLVRARRVEAGFDLLRTARVRGVPVGTFDGPDQAGHLGVPHTFVPTNQHTLMAPVPRPQNLREEKNEVFARGLRSNPNHS